MDKMSSEDLDLITAIEKAAYEVNQSWLLLRVLIYEAQDRGIVLPKEKIALHLQELLEFFRQASTVQPKSINNEPNPS